MKVKHTFIFKNSKQAELGSNIFVPNRAILILSIVTFLSASISSCQKQLLVLNGCAIQPNTVCIDANLNNLDLEGANLAGADLTGASLEGTNLKNANLEGAILTNIKVGNEADIEGTNFKNSFIFRSSIRNVKNADKANFEGAVLCNVMLPGELNLDHNSGCKSNKRFNNPNEVMGQWIDQS